MVETNAKQRFLTRDSVVEWLLEQATKSLDLVDGSAIFQATVTPEAAGAILRHLNENNPRPHGPDTSRKYAEDIREDNWHTSYSPLVFEGEEFSLVDGQHRLRGVVAAGEAVTFLVVIYGSPDARLGMDRHRPRGITVTHGINKKVSAGAKIVRRLEVGGWTAPTSDQIAETVAKYDGVIEVVEVAARRRPRITGRASFIAAFAIAKRHAGESYAQQVDDLLEDIASMAHRFDATRAIVALLERDQPGGAESQRSDEALKIIHGIVCHLEGKNRQILRPTTLGLRWFLPASKYRTETVSPQLAGAASRVRAAE